MDLSQRLRGMLSTVFCSCLQELKGRILLKGKKLGGLEDVPESDEGEVSNEDEAADMEEVKKQGQVRALSRIV